MIEKFGVPMKTLILLVWSLIAIYVFVHMVAHLIMADIEKKVYIFVFLFVADCA